MTCRLKCIHCRSDCFWHPFVYIIQWTFIMVAHKIRYRMCNNCCERSKKEKKTEIQEEMVGREDVFVFISFSIYMSIFDICTRDTPTFYTDLEANEICIDFCLTRWYLQIELSFIRTVLHTILCKWSPVQDRIFIPFRSLSGPIRFDPMSYALLCLSIV